MEYPLMQRRQSKNTIYFDVHNRLFTFIKFPKVHYFFTERLRYVLEFSFYTIIRYSLDNHVEKSLYEFHYTGRVVL